MPQTSPMNWLLISNLFFFFMFVNQTLLLEMNSVEKMKLFLILKSKIWLW